MLTSENWEAVKILVFTISVFTIGLVVLLEYKQAIFDQFLKILCIICNLWVRWEFLQTILNVVMRLYKSDVSCMVYLLRCLRLARPFRLSFTSFFLSHLIIG